MITTKMSQRSRRSPLLFIQIGNRYFIKVIISDTEWLVSVFKFTHVRFKIKRAKHIHRVFRQEFDLLIIKTKFSERGWVFQLFRGIKLASNHFKRVLIIR